MAYATVQDVQDRMQRQMSPSEQTMCAKMLDDAAIIIDAYNANAKEENKKLVSCNMVIRKMGDGEDIGIPIGATQGSMSGLGYSQSWTMSGGGAGEIYLSKLDKKILGVGSRIGARSVLERLVCR